MSLSSVEIVNSVEDVESHNGNKEASTDKKDEMEEGELLEEGELSDTGDNGTPIKNGSSSKNQHKNEHYSTSSSSHHSSSKKEKSPKISKSLSQTKDSSSKKRKHEQQQNSSLVSETKTANEDVNDVEAFLKKKKLELAEKVKNQLRLAGVEARVESGDDSDPECIKPDIKSVSNRTVTVPSTTSTRQNVIEAEKPSSSAKYYDLDKVEDPTETMISNWSKGKYHSDKSKIRSPTVNYDPYDEYYQSATTAEDESAKNDQDYRFTNNTSTSSDQDYRFGSGYDIDYRKKPLLNDVEFGSPDEASDGGVYSEEENAANEFGDIDERHRPSDKKRARGKRGGTKRLKPRRFDDSGAESNDDPEGPSYRRAHRPTDMTRRRRSRSPIVRRRGGGISGRGPNDRSDPPICKFFREGYCREGESCPYSHDLEPQRPADKKGELCKFYMNGFCRNGRRCPFLHGEYPCKFFHKGECSKGDDCRYSHEPLDEITRPIFDKMLKDEELASKVSVPDAPSRRKVLLGEPPKMGPPPPINGPHPSFKSSSPYNEPQKQPYHSRQDDFPPVDHRSNNSNYSSGHYPNQPYVNQMTTVHESQPIMSPLKDMSNNDNKDDGANDSGKVDIAAMLRQIKADVTGEEIQESPASPEPMNESANFVVVRQPNNLPEYRLIPFDLPQKNSASMSSLLQQSISDLKLSNDPRIKKLLSNQFDAVSDMISSQNAAKDQATDVSNKDPRAKSDPRTALNSRDPRLKPMAGFSGTSSSPPQQQQFSGIGSKLDGNMYGGNPMLSSQAMVMPMNFGNPPSMGPGVVTTSNFVSQMQIPTNPMMMNPGSMYMPSSSMMMSGNNGMGNNMQNTLPVMNPMVGGPSSATSSSWMPQIASNVPQSAMGGGWMPQQPMMMNQTTPDLSNQRYNGPVPMGQMPPIQSYNSGPVMDIQSKDPRSRRNLAPGGRGYGTESTEYSPPSQIIQDNMDSSATSPPSMNDRLLPPGVHRSGSESSGSLSLREKRKNMEFESPLNSFGAKSGTNTDENRYNTYSGSVKLKKKESVED